jgi:hypothetical protein
VLQTIEALRGQVGDLVRRVGELEDQLARTETPARARPPEEVRAERPRAVASGNTT